MLRHRRPGDAGSNPASLRQVDYQAWRAATLRDHYERYFAQVDLTGRDVLDFGCGDGGLSLHVAAKGVRSITGIDLKAELIDAARARAATLRPAAQPRFVAASDQRSIDLPDANLDVILCFDVLEHILEYEAIVREWVRVLRPGGRVLILWVPWLHPYGPHINSLVPIPWAHVLFSQRVLLDTCARVYDLPEFEPKLWDLDEHGRKKPNKWRELDRLPAVNRLTIRRFERLCREVGLAIERAQYRGFGGGALAWCTHALTRVPGVRELFTSHTVYELRKPPRASDA